MQPSSSALLLTQFEQAQSQTTEQRTAEQSLNCAAESAAMLEDAHIVAEQERELTQSQQGLIRAYAMGNKHPLQGQVTAVIDKSVAAEGFDSLVSSIGKAALKSIASAVPVVLSQTAKSLDHYCAISKTLAAKLRQLRPQLAALRGESAVHSPQFSLGAHKRFFQSNDAEITDFAQFAAVFKNQCDLARHGFTHGVNYSLLISDRILADFSKLQASGSKDLRNELKDTIAYHWKHVWKEGFAVKKPGVVPREYLREVPECKIYPVCPLFDARVLVATEPQKAREAMNVGKYRATIAFDKKSLIKPSGEIATPSASELLESVDAAITLLNDMGHYKELSAKCAKTAKAFEKHAKITLDALNQRSDSASVTQALQYMQIAASCGQIMTAPHTELAWMHVRSALVVASLAEHVLFNAPKDMSITTQFFADAKSSLSVGAEAYEELADFLKALRP